MTKDNRYNNLKAFSPENINNCNLAISSKFYGKCKLNKDNYSQHYIHNNDLIDNNDDYNKNATLISGFDLKQAPKGYIICGSFRWLNIFCLTCIFFSM